MDPLSLRIAGNRFPRIENDFSVEKKVLHISVEQLKSSSFKLRMFLVEYEYIR